MVLGLKVFSSRARDFAEEMNTEGMIPGIKLFGRKILAPERYIPADSDAASAFPTASQATNVCCAISNGESEKAENSVKSLAARTAEKDRQNLDPDNDDNDEQEKTFKKPDKIVPCPRCNSFDTKFCYFNNYNVNQPRHFCKNCQRYWTAGGTMRNVPIGAGRRKNKQFASQYRFNANGAPTNNVESPDTTNHHLLFPPGGLPSSETIKGTVLKFGPDTCLSESVENTLHLKEQQHKVEEEAVSGKSSSSCSEQEKMVSSVTYDYNHDPPFHPLQHQQIPALFFPWTGLAANVSSFQWCSSSMVAIPGPLNVPLQIVAAPCVGGVPLYPSGAGNVPLALFNGSHCLPSSTSNNGFPPTLGKHLRDPNAADGGILERSALVPKVPRVDGPTEASKGPLRTPLHIEPHEKVSSLYGAVDATGSGSKGEGSGIESVL